MATFYFAGVPFDLPNGVQITETVISDNFRSYYSASPGGEGTSFSLTKIGDNFWEYSGDINLSVTKLGEIFTDFSGDVSGSVTKIGSFFSGMEEERRDFLFEVFDSQSTVVDPGNTSENHGTSTYEWRGTAGDDKISTYDLYRQNPSYNNFRLIGGEGADSLSLSIMGRNGVDSADGGGGDDTLVIASYKTDYATAVVEGGSGSDRVYFPLASPALGSDGTPDFRVDGTLIEVRLDDEEVVSAVAIDVEMIDFGNGGMYLTEDIYNGRIRAVDFSEAFARAYGDNSDWYIKGLDTYSEYHSAVSVPDITESEATKPETAWPEVTKPKATNPEVTEPKRPAYDGIIESVSGKGKLRGTEVADVFAFDSFDVLTKKSADEIIGFDPSQGDSIAVSRYAFPALMGASAINFASTRNKKELKLLSKQDYDFVYFEKKGYLYFDGNGSDKDWGNTNTGGLVAILKGKPELTVEDFTLMA
jgi:hypothetical protein